MPDGEGGFAKLILIGPAPGKISLPFIIALAEIALSIRSKLTNPQFLWVSTRAEIIGPCDLNISVRVETVVDDGMLPSQRAVVGPSRLSFGFKSSPLFGRPRDIAATAAGRSSYSLDSEIPKSAALMLLSSRDAVG